MTGCTDDSCIVEVGKLLSANKILLGNASRLGGESSGRFATKIGTPGDFTVTDDGYHKDKVALKWKKVKGADNYYIFRYNDDKDKFEKIHSTKKTSFEDYKTEVAESYKYKVRAGFYSKTGKFTEVKTGSRGRSATGYYMRGIIPGWSQFYYTIM